MFVYFSDMDTLQVCVVRALEECEESTPANLVESMFKFVRNETPCVNISSVSLRLKKYSKINFEILFVNCGQFLYKF